MTVHTMRSAFKRWAELHGEHKRTKNHTRIPNWFRWYIRNNCEWSYIKNDGVPQFNYCRASSINTVFYNNDLAHERRFKGYYQFEITDEELINLQRPTRVLN